MIQRVPGELWGRCNTIDQIYRNNIAYLTDSLLFEWTDELPYLEPWIGVGVYANAFGCEYLWRDDNAPDTHYMYHKIKEVRDIEVPDYQKSTIMRMVLDCIDHFKEETRGQLPICLTDTQSPFDTATLVLDASEFLTACYTDEETAWQLMQSITDLIIEFSRVQRDCIGEELLVKPGHILPSSTSYRGISISDDNLSVSSPWINERIALPFDQQIADAFDGLAIHSCGRWEHTMAKLGRLRNVLMVDCALSAAVDPTPCVAAEVREALKGSGIIAQVRVGSELDEVLPLLEELFDPSLKLVVNVAYSPERAEENYKRVRGKLGEMYAFPSAILDRRP